MQIQSNFRSKAIACMYDNIQEAPIAVKLKGTLLQQIECLKIVNFWIVSNLDLWDLWKHLENISEPWLQVHKTFSHIFV